MRNTPFGRQQLAWLQTIVESPDGITDWRLERQLSSRRKQRSLAYKDALRSAISRHNSGTCPSNCPLPADVKIERGEIGPRGGRGWKAVQKEEVTQ